MIEMDEEVIKKVDFSMARTQGKCSRCGEVGEMMLVRAYISYQDRTGVLKTAKWDIFWCSYCYNDMMGLAQKADEQIAGLYA